MVCCLSWCGMVKEFEFPSLYFFEIIDSIFREKGQHFYEKAGNLCIVVSDAGPLYLDPFPETICDIAKYVIYLVTKLRYVFFANSRDIIIDWFELLISPID